VNNFLQILFNVATENKIPTVLIGGLALPAYSVTRTTLDIDICIRVKSQKELNQFLEALKKKEIQTVQNPEVSHDYFTIFGRHNEAEVWLKPCDTFHWDPQMVKKIQNFFANIYVLAVEDYILTKLARSDRSSIDISDILQILIANKNEIDMEYLYYRLKWVGLTSDFKEILRGFSLDLNNNMRKISEEILDKFKQLD
jgi:hypothetical protein